MKINLLDTPRPNIFPTTRENALCSYFTTKEEYDIWDKNRTTHRGVFIVPWFDDVNCTPFIDKWIEEKYKFNGTHYEFNYFEWGIGGSTIHFGSKAAISYSTDSSVDWINRIGSYIQTFNPGALKRINVIYESPGHAYCNSISNLDCMFDVILIDGVDGTRNDCLDPAINKLSIGGLLIIDNVGANFDDKLCSDLENFKILEKFKSTWCLEKII